MRVTKTKLSKPERTVIRKLVESLIQSEDITLSADFAEDAYALFKEKISKRRIFKNFWQLFSDVKGLYTKFKLGDLMKNIEFYSNIRNFFRYFISSKLFHELNKFDPLEALEKFLRMFQNPAKAPQPAGMPAQGSQNAPKTADQQPDDQMDGSGKKNKPQPQKDQKGLSADENNIPIDMTKFKQDLPKIEKTIESGLFDEEDFQDYLQKYAGVEHKEIQIGNISDLVKKIANKLTKEQLDIFYIARHKELTEHYHRDEVLESVPYPDDEMSIRNIEEPHEILKLLPTQYAYEDDVFTQKLLRKDLLVRDYQSRRLKRQSLYLLVDVSGSMEGIKNVYASGVALALVRQALQEGSVYFLRFFDANPHDLIKIVTKEDAKSICETLISHPFSGGGTSIQGALEVAISDIDKSPEQFEKSEILVITDGEDDVTIDRDALKNIKVHSTIIDGSNDKLKSVSDTYLELASSDIDL